MAEPNKSAVPKFSSFKPKSVPAKDISASGPPVKDDRRKDEKTLKHRDRDRHRSSKDHDRKKERDHAKSSSGSGQAIARVDTSDLVIRSEDHDYIGAYRVDTTGDVANLRYGSLHRYSVPAYRRSGCGNVMGADARAKIDRALSDEKGIVVDAPESSSRNKRRPLLKNIIKDTRSLRIIHSNTESQRLDHDMDFLALLPNRKKLRRSESPMSERGEVDYRSIEGKAKDTDEPNDPDLEYLTSSSAENGREAESEVVARRTNAQLFRRTRDEPHDLAAWLTLIDHQAILLGFMPNETLSSSEQRHLADMRLSIYEEALKAIDNDVESKTTLQLGILEEGAKIWEASKLSEQWDRIFQANKTNIRVCIAYLNHVQTSFVNFDYDRCKATVLECLQNISTTLSAAPIAPRSGHMKAAVYIFLRLTMLMREAGYHEFAEALWQAVLELQFFRPSNLKIDSDVAARFEHFWESEVPRIGEHGSKGWKHFVEGTQEIPEPITIEVETIEDGEEVFRRFVVAERETAEKLSHAGRSSDDAGEDDPYHIVLFNDVEAVLFPAMLRLSSARDLVSAFLLFLGLPPLPEAEDREYEAWWLDPYLTSPAINTSRLPAPVQRQITTEVLFSDAFDEVQLSDPLWVRRALESLIVGNSDDDKLAEYFLAFEFRFDPSTAAKSAKRLLKARPHSLRLYNAYAIIQTRLKGQPEGSSVFLKTLGMADTLGAVEQSNAVLLWRTWVFEALRTNALSEAKRRLLCVGAANPSADAAEVVAEPVFTPGAVLRTKRFLVEGRDRMLSTGLDHLAALYVELFSLFVYFQSDGSLQAGLDIYAEASGLYKNRGKEHSPGHEHLHQAKAALLALHQQETPLLKPSIIRDCLVASVTLFPNNTGFLKAYTNNEKRFRLDDRVRAVLSDIVLQEKSDTVAGWNFAIQNEMHRGLEFGGTSYAVSAVFDKAVQRAGKHNIGLWTAYFLFELSRDDKQRAKQVFFRGLTNLPWSKWFIMIGIEHMDGYLSFEDIRNVWRVLGEKNLRIHVDVQDLLDDIAERASRHKRLEQG